MPNSILNESKKSFFWACFLHFLGWDNDALNCIKPILSETSNKFILVLNELEKYIKLVSSSKQSDQRKHVLAEIQQELYHFVQTKNMNILKEIIDKLDESLLIPQKDFIIEIKLGLDRYKQTRNMDILDEIQQKLSHIIQTEKRNMLNEIQQNLNRLIEEYNYGSEEKFPRIPKHHINRDISNIDNGDLVDWFCAIVAYLLRGYCSFWTGKSYVGADYNSAKGALNDLVQAHFLLLRLETRPNANDWIKLSGEKFGLPMSDILPMLHKWLHALVDIFRGNIYSKIRDRSQAVLCYERAINLIQPRSRWSEYLQQMVKEERCSVPSDIHSFTCRTLAKAKFELSKAHLDQGLFLTALMYQLDALQDLLLVPARFDTAKESQKQNGKKPLWQLCRNIMEIINCLQQYKDYAFFPKKEIHAYFGGVGYRNELNCEPITPDDFEGAFLDESTAYIAADIFARIGFLLFILKISMTEIRESEKPKEEPDYQHIRNFFKPKNLPKTPYAAWGKLLLDREESTVQFFRTPERLLAMHILESFSKLRSPKDEEEIVRLVTRLGQAGMQYIDNVVTIPQQISQHLMRDGYKERRRKLEKRDQRNAINKLVVLRRWQSYNPKVPHPRGMEIRGGGLFLYWYGKGFVIDPGYDFVRNFYDQGFSLEDIDAIVITHSHPDHDDELSTILTLIAEWNEFWERNCGPDHYKTIDLFLNEGSFRKYDSWVHTSKVAVSNIFTLQTNVWDKGEGRPENLWPRDQNQRIFLRDKAPTSQKKRTKGYNLDIEVVPAWHDEIMDTRSAVGVILHLFKPVDSPKKDELPVLKIGLTGDTGDFNGRAASLSSFYKDCDVVVANLGDIKLREIEAIIRRQEKNFQLPLEDFIKSYFGWESTPNDIKIMPTQEKIRNFMRLLTSLDLADARTLKEWKWPMEGSLCIEMQKENYIEFSCLLDFLEWILNTDKYDEVLRKEVQFRQTLTLQGHKIRDVWFLRMNEWRDTTEAYLRRFNPEATFPEIHILNYMRYDRDVFTVFHLLQGTISLLCNLVHEDYSPPFHLGMGGLLNIHQKMIEAPSKPNRILVIGELPEELSSYRHLIARFLDNRKENLWQDEHDEVSFPIRKVRCLTGDIGLHIGLQTDGVKFGEKRREHEEQLDVAVRCVLCNQNNELVRGTTQNSYSDTSPVIVRHYHPPSQIQETALVRMDSSIIYLCTLHHASMPLEQPIYFPNYLETW